MNELDVLEITWKVLIFHSFFTGFTQLLMTAPYGRYARAGYGITLNARFTWLVQECPSFLVPLFVTAYLGGNQWKAPNLVLLSMFLLHYFHRSFHYPFVIKGSKPVPLMIFVVSLIFCAINGYMQSRYLLHYYSYTDQWFYDPRFIIGVVMFLFGMAINIHSDAILRGLRKPNETGYKIPKGGLFEFVSCANYFGEALEWWGYCVACWSPPAMAFAVSTTCVLGTRALSHHKYYLQKMEDYPKDRKAFIPFIC